MRVALLFNPASGEGRGAEVERALRENGVEVRARDVREAGDGLPDGTDRLVVAGGDGSIGLAAAAAAGAGIPLAVIPTGTANDFARAFELPTDLADACELAARGTSTRRIEVGRAGERAFVNLASIGLSPEAADEADGLKQKLGPLAYPAGAVKAGVTADPVRCEVRCEDGVVHEGKAWQVSIACTGAFGGGASLEADATDGRLDVVVIEGGSRARLVKHAYGLGVGTVEGQKGVRDARCREVSLRVADEECLNIDGEVVAAGELSRCGAIEFRVDPSPLELVVG